MKVYSKFTVSLFIFLSGLALGEGQYQTSNYDDIVKDSDTGQLVTYKNGQMEPVTNPPSDITFDDIYVNKDTYIASETYPITAKRINEELPVETIPLKEANVIPVDQKSSTERMQEDLNKIAEERAKVEQDKAEVKNDILTEQDKNNKSLKRAWTRVALAGAFGTLGTVMTTFMAKEEKRAAANVEELERILNNFQNSANAFIYCSSSDRDNSSKPYCYCTGEDGRANPARISAPECNRIGSGIGDAGNYNSGGDDVLSSLKVCLTNGGRSVDVSCRCKSTNSCTKMKMNFSGVGANSANYMGGLVDQANQAFSGNAGTGDASVSGYMSGAAKLKKLRDKILAKDPELKNHALKLEKNMIGNLQHGARIKKIAASTGGPSRSNLSSKVASALPSGLAKKVNEIVNTKDSSRAVAMAGKKGAKKDNYDFGFDDEGSGGVEIDEAMNQNYDYAGAGVVNSKGASIFKVLSTRYISSGMRRLFGEGQYTPESSNSEEIRR